MGFIKLKLDFYDGLGIILLSPLIMEKKMNQEFKITISLLPIFHDSSYPQTDPRYIKILLDPENKIIQKKLNAFHVNIDKCLSDIFEENIKIKYEWPEKELVACRKENDEIEIIYKAIMPFFKDSIKKGNIVNITDFPNLVLDKYYVECIVGTPRKFG